MMKKLQLLFGAKGEEVCRKVFSLHNRFPIFFPPKLLKELSCFLSNAKGAFLEERSAFTLLKILFALHRLTLQVAKTESRDQRVFFSFLELSSSVYGVPLLLTSLGDHEVFEEKSILQGIHKLLPGIKPIPDSYHCFNEENFSLFYLEIKKVRGGIFSLSEKEKLLLELQEEFEKQIIATSPALFLPGNEEELFKNIRHLGHEIKRVDDLPEVMVTFIGYFQDTLKFLVTVVRVILPQTQSICSLCSRLPASVQFSLDSIFCVDRLRSKYPKEAAVFTLEVGSHLFLRGGYQVNLRTARQFITKALENMIGPFRDYNGGLLIKENEQLIAIKRMLEDREIFFPYLEDLFYGIKPITMRAIISNSTGVELVSLFQKIAKRPLLSHEKYCLETSYSDALHLAILKTKQKEWQTTFRGRIQAYSSQIGCACLEYGDSHYLCFFHQCPCEPILQDAFEKELSEQVFVEGGKKKKSLTLNFQGGDPSSLNPRLAHDIHSHILCSFLFEGLMRIDASGQVLPAAAEKVKISSERTHYTFWLRNSRWSNGEEVTAYDFERTWKKALMASSTSYMCPNFFSLIKNANQVRMHTLPPEALGVRAKNAKTLCVELEAPCSYFLNLVAAPPYFPLFGEAEEPTAFNGPFTLAQEKMGSWLYLSKNPFYWNANEVKLGGISILMVRNSQKAFALFQKGELDIIGDPTSPLSPQMIQSPRVENNFCTKPISRVFWLHCNTHIYPLHNSSLRRALSLALDRKRLTEKVFIKQTPHLSFLPPKYSQVDGNVHGDPEKALAYFAKALKELKIDRKELPPLVLTHSDLSFDKPLLEELRTQWKEVLGITILSKQLSWSEFSSALEKGEFQLGGLFRRDLFNHPAFYLSFFKQSSNNPHAWENEEYARLLECFEREENPKEVMQSIEHVVINEAPVIPLVSQRYLVLINQRVRGIQWVENGCLDLHKAWIKDFF